MRGDTIVASGALADFILSCSSPRSRNYDQGWRFARGTHSPDVLAEGWQSVEAFVSMIRSQHIDSHYFDAIAAAAAEPARVAASLQPRSE